MNELRHAKQSSEQQTQLSATMFDVFRQIIDQKDTQLKFFISSMPVYKWMRMTSFPMHLLASQFNLELLGNSGQ